MNKEQIAIKKLDKYMHRFHEQMIDGLNHNVIKQGLQPGNTYYVTEIYEDLNWQEIPSDDDAFNLVPPVAGFVKQKQVKRKAFVKRIAFGYVATMRISEQSYEEFYNFIMPYYLLLIEGLKKVKGFGPEQQSTGGVYITLQRPGNNKSYFRSLTDTCGFELRAYSDCVKTNILMGKLPEEKVYK